MHKLTDEELDEIACGAAIKCSFKSKTLVKGIIKEAIQAALKKNSEKSGSSEWREINNSNVRHVWIKNSDDHCQENTGDVYISPDWYQGNGTPICVCGEDMEYSHTEIFIYR